MFPEALRHRLNDWAEENGRSRFNLSNAKLIDGTKQFSFLDKYFVVPKFHPSDDMDWHGSYEIICILNMESIRDVTFRKMNAEVGVYQKINEQEPGYLVVWDFEENAVDSVIMWPA